ncbi:MAG: hypothetical protein KJO13_02975, partial [Gammaproteobacteria bacterium]|nr:hypothetical protein [Gammaproteobacteria bacterium]
MKTLTKILIALSSTALIAAPAAFGANDKGNGGKPERVDVIVGYHGKPAAAQKDKVRGLGGEVRREFSNFDMHVVSLPKHAVENMRRSNGVAFVVPDEPIETFSASARATARATSVDYAMKYMNAYGIGIAVIDS